MVRKKAGPGSDLNAVNSMKRDKVIGDLDEQFKETPILDRGNRASKMVVMTPIKGEEHMQCRIDKKKRY